MARSLNKAMIIGNLGADPEIRAVSNGARVATLRVATSRTWTDRGGQQQEKTEWHRVVAWEKLADICERYLKKGDRVYVEGSIETRKWEGQDGQTHYMTEIRARDMLMLGGRVGGEPAGQRPVPAAGGGEADFSEFSNDALAGEDDLPF